MRARDVTPLALLLFACLSAAPAHAEDQKPWETPNSGYTSGSTGSTPGHDKIETVINTTGGTRSDGTQVSNTGTSEQKSYVDGFLNDAATKIKEAGGGTGWAWTWEKKWKIGPDGKPYEVKETWADGNIGIKSNPEAAAPGNTPSSQPAAQPSSAPAAQPAASPAATSSPASSRPGRPPAPSSTSSTPSSSSSPSAPPASAKASPSAPAALSPKGLDPAPAKIPQPSIMLSIFDPISQQECRYAAAVTPSKPGRVPRVASITRPIYEDTRVKIGLDLGPGIDSANLSVTVHDNEGDHAYERGSFPPNYRHIFRVPNLKEYFASVVYEHPISKERQEIINVQIPVLKMSFANRTVESSSARTGDPELTTSGNSSGGQSAPTGWGASTGSARRDTTAGGDQTYDMSDLYTDPANPPEVAGSGGTSAGDETSSSNTPITSAARADQGSVGSAGSSGTDADAIVSGNLSGSTPGSAVRTASRGSASPDVSGRTGMESGNQSSSNGGSNAAFGSGTRPGGDPGASQSGARGNTAQTVSGYTESGSPATGDATTGQEASYALAPDATAADDDPSVARNADGRAAHPEGVTVASVQQNAKPYLLSVSIQNRATNAAQSFDFLTDPAPVAQTISPQTPLAISIDYAPNVLRDSVKIEIFDGQDRITTSPVEMRSGIVEHIFTNQTGDAYVWVYGRTDQAPFSYKIMIPVTGL